MSVQLQFLGQSGIRLAHGDDVVYLDPCLSDVVARSVDASERPLWERRFPPPLAADAVDDATAVLVTHEHIDHFDPDTLVPLARASAGARFLVPGAMAGLARRTLPDAAIELATGDEDEHRLGGLRVVALPAAHSERYATEPAPGGQRWLGYVIEVGGVRLYHAGDTVLYDGLVQAVRRHGPLDVALLPINGRDAGREAHGVTGNLWPREAADLAVALGAAVLIPLHHDLFAWNGIAPGQLVDDVVARGLALEVRVLTAGQTTRLGEGSTFASESQPGLLPARGRSYGGARPPGGGVPNLDGRSCTCAS